ncbi:Methyltranfer-dom domain-containing protein [Mycena venus]|uniref:Methyltranfer-dom domain-containing protein n=1 Tax=Mycena venus TaxID=2733690 RepID=A0A8H7CM73_9AGAR|nr:Methyltranfer-dom domain-containing protein [Mycena venus]
MLSPDILQRVNRKMLAQQWRWLALSGACLLVFTVYLCSAPPSLQPGHDADTPPKFVYGDLLTTTNANNCSLPIELGGTSRLARTLEGNERRYQHMIVERGKNYHQVGGIWYQRANLLWDYFIPAFSCPFPMYRVGSLAEGGKWVCGVERILHSRPNCIIYSLNDQSPSYSTFEENILQRSPGCQIHAFDANATRDAPSKWPWGETNDVGHLFSSRVHFYHFAISDPTAKEYRSLQSVMRGLGHDWIDILKIDLKGAEFATLLAIIADNQDEPLPFGQLIVTVQTGLTDDMKKVSHFSDWFTRLECAGLRPYYFEVSMMDVNNRRDEPSLVYWSFMNIRGRHALVDDSLPEYP